MQLISACTYLQQNPSQGEIIPAPLQTGHTPLTIYKLNSACIWGNVHPVISPLEENTDVSYVLSEFSCFYHDTYLKENLDNCNNQHVTSYFNNCAFLAHPWAQEYYHWMIETLPQILLLESIGFQGSYILRSAPQFVKETFELFNIPLSKILVYSKPLSVKNLYFVENLHYKDFFNHGALLTGVRERLLSAVPPRKHTPSRIYISRKNKRAVENEPALLEFLKQYNFTVVHMETLSLTEQIQLMRNASVLLGPHGAGMTHSLFMQPRSLVVEFFSNYFVHNTLLPITLELKHKYIPLPEFYESHPQGYIQRPINEYNLLNMIVHIPFVRSILESHL